MKNQNEKKNIGLYLKVLEIICYFIGTYFAYYIALQLDLFAGYDSNNIKAFNNTIFLVMGFNIFIILLLGILNTVNLSSFENVVRIVTMVFITAVSFMAIAFYSRDFAVPRTVIILGAIIQLIFFLMIKYIFIRIIKLRKKTRNIILLCHDGYKETLVTKVLTSHIYKERLTFCVDPKLCSNYMQYVDKADKIYVADDIDGSIKDEVVSHCISLDKSLYIIPKTFEISIFNSRLIQVSDVPVFKVDSLYLSQENVILKRIFDLTVSIIALIVLSPIMIITALVMLVTEGRPLLYTQERVTKNNKVFKLYKFRSMTIDAEKKSGPMWAQKNDPRITPVGKFLRRFWLDELPQLFNVIKGDMSFVGPRPERPVFIEEFSKKLPHFKYRLAVKAGVTGLAQVLGRYATTPDLKIKYDLLYIKQASLKYDIMIILETVKKVIKGLYKSGDDEEPNYNELLVKCGYKELVNEGVTEYK